MVERWNMDQNDKPKRGRVLRATDVIPPFDKDARNLADRRPEGPPYSRPAHRAQDGVEMPSYDLAEHILAEQRRAAGRRRRGPGRVEDTSVAPAHSGARNLSPLPSRPAAPDVLELQRVVAEIVARDIERLCRRPDRPSSKGYAARLA